MKKCPFCAEEIQEDAIKCRFCHEFLEGKAAQDLQTKKTEWYFKTSTIIAGFCFVGPLILPLIWFHPTYSKKKKTVLTVACLVVTVLVGKIVQSSLVSIDEYYQLIQGNY
jgi:uncharacterized membrane protein YvbJ